MEKKPTIKTIARIAGVSHVAVSKALRDAPDISVQTKARIIQIARDVGYTANVAARNLSTNKSGTIGMIVPAMGENTAYNAIFNEISAVAAENGYCVMLGSSHRDIELEKKHCKMMVGNRVGALIVASCTSDVSHIKDICRNMIPVLFVGGKTDPNEKYSMLCDYRYSATLAVEHLYNLGHRDIAFFAYGPDNLTIRQKEEGFITEMAKRGLPPKIFKAGHASNTLAAGMELTQQLIASNNLPTAVWCASDLMAVGVLNALKAHGLSAPEDISIIGHDDLFFDIFPDIELTTLHTPMAEIGRETVKLALSLIDGEKEIEHQQVFHTSLIIRNTTGKYK